MPAPIELCGLYRNIVYGFCVIVAKLEYFESGVNVVFDTGMTELLELFQRQYRKEKG